MDTTATAATPATPAPLSGTDRTRLRRERERTVTDREVLAAILAEGTFCHLGVVVDGSPVVLPTTYAYDLGPDAPDAPDGTLYLHGSVAARSLVAGPDQTVCVTITLVDGLVLARSGFHHSANYRSAVVFGRPRKVEGAEKEHALDLMVDHVVPGRSAALRRPTRKELAATTVLALPLSEVSVKARAGDVADDPADEGLPVWAGVVPLRTTAADPVAAADVPADVGVPAHVTAHVDHLNART